MERLNLPDPRPPSPPVDVEDTSSALRQELHDLRHACEELRADLDWLTGDVAKLRGKITGGSRRPPKDNGSPEDQPTLDVNALIKAGHFRRR